MKKTGQILREARESKGVSLQEASLHLKIGTKILKSMEDGDMTALPAKTFVRGFVQSYAQFLKLDPKKILDLFQEEMGTTHPGMITAQVENINQPAPASQPGATSAAPAPTTPAKSKEPIPPRVPPLAVDPQSWSIYTKATVSLVIIAIVLLIIFIKRTIDRYEREGQVAQIATETIKPIEPVESVSPVSSDPNSIIAPAAQLNEPVIPTTNTPANSTEPPSTASSATTLPAAPPVATSTATAPSKPTTTPPPAATVPPVVTQPQIPPANPPPTPKPQAPTTTTTAAPTLAQAPQAPPQEVIVEALDKVTIEYNIDGSGKNSVSLKAEQVHTFKAKEKMSLVFSDGGAVNIIHNGKDRGVPGNLGQPLKVTYP